MLNHMNMSVDEMHQQIMSRILQNHILFKPVVQEIISENENTFKSYSLCIHIRTQGPNFLRFDDLPNVIRCIDDYQLNTSNVFICSDNSTIQSTVGNMISNTSKISYETIGGKWNFNTLNRDRQSVLFAEMKLLSMCQTYLGTYRNTWSYTNALLSDGRRLFIGHNATCSNTVSFWLVLVFERIIVWSLSNRSLIKEEESFEYNSEIRTRNRLDHKQMWMTRYNLLHILLLKFRVHCHWIILHTWLFWCESLEMTNSQIIIMKEKVLSPRKGPMNSYYSIKWWKHNILSSLSFVEKHLVVVYIE